MMDDHRPLNESPGELELRESAIEIVSAAASLCGGIAGVGTFMQNAVDRRRSQAAQERQEEREIRQEQREEAVLEALFETPSTYLSDFDLDGPYYPGFDEPPIDLDGWT